MDTPPFNSTKEYQLNETRNDTLIKHPSLYCYIFITYAKSTFEKKKMIIDHVNKRV